jgi:hypothetical protein
MHPVPQNQRYGDYREHHGADERDARSEDADSLDELCRRCTPFVPTHD